MHGAAAKGDLGSMRLGLVWVLSQLGLLLLFTWGVAQNLYLVCLLATSQWSDFLSGATPGSALSVDSETGFLIWHVALQLSAGLCTAAALCRAWHKSLQRQQAYKVGNDSTGGLGTSQGRAYARPRAGCSRVLMQWCSVACLVLGEWPLLPALASLLNTLGQASVWCPESDGSSSSSGSYIPPPPLLVSPITDAFAAGPAAALKLPFALLSTWGPSALLVPNPTGAVTGTESRCLVSSFGAAVQGSALLSMITAAVLLMRISAYASAPLGLLALPCAAALLLIRPVTSTAVLAQLQQSVGTVSSSSVRLATCNLVFALLVATAGLLALLAMLPSLQRVLYAAAEDDACHETAEASSPHQGEREGPLPPAVVAEPASAAPGAVQVKPTAPGAVQVKPTAPGAVQVKPTAPGAVQVKPTAPGAVQVKPTAPGAVQVKPTAPGAVQVKPTAPGAVQVKPTAPGAVQVKPTAAGVGPKGTNRVDRADSAGDRAADVKGLGDQGAVRRPHGGRWFAEVAVQPKAAVGPAASVGGWMAEGEGRSERRDSRQGRDTQGETEGGGDRGTDRGLEDSRLEDEVRQRKGRKAVKATLGVANALQDAAKAAPLALPLALAATAVAVGTAATVAADERWHRRHRDSSSGGGGGHAGVVRERCEVPAAASRELWAAPPAGGASLGRRLTGSGARPLHCEIEVVEEEPGSGDEEAAAQGPARARVSASAVRQLAPTAGGASAEVVAASAQPWGSFSSTTKEVTTAAAVSPARPAQVEGCSSGGQAGSWGRGRAGDSAAGGGNGAAAAAASNGGAAAVTLQPHCGELVVAFPGGDNGKAPTAAPTGSMPPTSSGSLLRPAAAAARGRRLAPLPAYPPPPPLTPAPSPLPPTPASQAAPAASQEQPGSPQLRSVRHFPLIPLPTQPQGGSRSARSALPGVHVTGSGNRRFTDEELFGRRPAWQDQGSSAAVTFTASTRRATLDEEAAPAVPAGAPVATPAAGATGCGKEATAAAPGGDDRSLLSDQSQQQRGRHHVLLVRPAATRPPHPPLPAAEPVFLMSRGRPSAGAARPRSSDVSGFVDGAHGKDVHAGGLRAASQGSVPLEVAPPQGLRGTSALGMARDGPTGCRMYCLADKAAAEARAEALLHLGRGRPNDEEYEPPSPGSGGEGSFGRGRDGEGAWDGPLLRARGCCEAAACVATLAVALAALGLACGASFGAEGGAGSSGSGGKPFTAYNAVDVALAAVHAACALLAVPWLLGCCGCCWRPSTAGAGEGREEEATAAVPWWRRERRRRSANAVLPA